MEKKATSVSHLPYTWDKMKPAKMYKGDGIDRKHFKKATSGMEPVASSKRDKRPYSDG